MLSSGTSRHKLRLGAAALIAVLAPFAWPSSGAADLQLGALPPPPCYDVVAPTIAAMRMDHDASAVPRDGFLVAFETGMVPGKVGPGTKAFSATTAPFQLQLRNAAGEVVQGSTHPRPRGGLIFRPSQPLAPTAQYTLHTRIDPNSKCFTGPVIEQDIAFVTEADFRPAVPAALDGVAYGRVWTPSNPKTYCCRTERARCAGAESCLACWDHRQEPLILTRAKFDPAQEESANLITALEIHDADGSVYLNEETNWRREALGTPIYPVRDSLFDWGFNPVRICVRASTETLRTGAIARAERCIDIDAKAVADGTSLAGVTLPPLTLLAPPAEPAFTPLGVATACIAPDAPRPRDIVYAARFVATPPAGAALLYESGSVGARSDAKADAGVVDGGTRTMTSSDAGSPAAPASHGDVGCSVTPRCTRTLPAFLLLGVACAAWRRRKRG